MILHNIRTTLEMIKIEHTLFALPFAFLGAVLAVVALDWMPRINQYILSVAAASFLYVAMADLIPDLHRGRIDARTLRELVLAVAGIYTVVALNTFLGEH